MKIAFFEIHDWEIEILKKQLKGHTLKFFKTPLTKESLKEIKDFDIISVFIYSNVTKEITEGLPNLKLVVTRSTGYNHIDYAFCAKRGIKVCNIPYYGENTVAEHTFALILALSRKIHHSYMKIMANDFSIEELEGFDLKGKTIGVVGTGHIGSHAIRMAKGFEMNVLAHDYHENKQLAKELDFRYTNLNEILKKSDIVTLHVPFLKENYHMINAKSLKMMKPTALLINTARGELVDTNALLKALKENKLAGAGLDVIEGESLIKEEKELLHGNHRKEMQRIAEDLALIRNEKVVFTPHIAFYSIEALHRILNTTIDNINAFIKNKPINLVKNV
jgi:D-lactate dehydrogenase